MAAKRGVLVAFSDRRGGFSEGPFESLNLAARVGDEAKKVEANREAVAEVAGFDHNKLAFAKQVHGSTVLDIGPTDNGVVGEGDVLVTRSPGPVLCVLTADCVPVILVGERGVAAVHAGWRGLVAGAIERGIAAVQPVRAAWVGPGIRGCCYEVGPEVVEAFHAEGLPVEDDEHVDPVGAARFALGRAGVGNFVTVDQCTGHNSNYFSYRRDGVTGRQGAFVGIRR